MAGLILGLTWLYCACSPVVCVISEVLLACFFATTQCYMCTGTAMMHELTYGCDTLHSLSSAHHLHVPPFVSNHNPKPGSNLERCGAHYAWAHLQPAKAYLLGK